MGLIDWIKRGFANKETKVAEVKPVQPVSPPTKLPERPNPDAIGLGRLRYPAAIHNVGGLMKTIGRYANGYPQGAIVHFTSGSSAESSLSWGIESGYCFFLIAKDGTVYQNFDLDKWGYHAGSSSWPGLSGSVSDELVGIEIDCAGGLEKVGGGKFKSWFGRMYDEACVRYSSGKDNVKPGYYEMYTPEQETALIALLRWLKSNKPDVFDFDFVLGHDEVAPSRKDDPGASLSMTMPKFREHLKELESQPSAPVVA
jgi:hypothetical protein